MSENKTVLLKALLACYTTIYSLEKKKVFITYTAQLNVIICH